MKRLFGSWLLLIAAVTLDAQPLKVEVLIYNYAGVSAETLARAEREAARIYDRAGIETEWLDCPLTSEVAARYPACQLPVSPTRPILRILSRSMAGRIGLTQTAFGSALLPEDGGFAMTAQVCAHCAEELAKGGKAMHAVILGHLMAHELGHLLLGVGSHSLTGLMHVRWQTRDLESAAQGSLLFTSREAGTMRRQVSARLQGESLELASGK